MNKTEVIRARVSSEEKNLLADSAKKVGLKYSDLIRFAIPALSEIIKENNSTIKKKVAIAKKEGRPVSIKSLFDVDDVKIEKALNRRLYEEILKKSKK